MQKVDEEGIDLKMPGLTTGKSIILSVKTLTI